MRLPVPNVRIGVSPTRRHSAGRTRDAMPLIIKAAVSAGSRPPHINALAPRACKCSRPRIQTSELLDDEPARAYLHRVPKRLRGDLADLRRAGLPQPDL